MRPARGTVPETHWRLIVAEVHVHGMAIMLHGLLAFNHDTAGLNRLENCKWRASFIRHMDHTMSLNVT